MVSPYSARLEDVKAEDHIQPGYTSLFSCRHADLPPHLSRSAIVVGFEGVAYELQRRFGGAAYLPASRADDPLLTPVAGAPDILQPVFITVQVRRAHEALIQRAIRSLEAIAANSLVARTAAIFPIFGIVRASIESCCLVLLALSSTATR